MSRAKKFRPCFRAISPVISTLFMIAIVVVASLVAYAWVMGYIGKASQKGSEAIAIQSVARDTLSGYLILYVQNIGQGQVKFDPNACVYVNNVLQYSTPTPSSLPQGQTATLTTIYQITSNAPLTIKVVTTDGTSAQTSTDTQAFAMPTWPPTQNQLQITFKMGTGGAALNPSGKQTYARGARIPLSATPQVGYSFNKWASDTNQIVFEDITIPTTWATINGQGLIIASFTPNKYPVTFTLGTGGATLNPSGTQTYAYNDHVQISTTALNGYTFAAWAATANITIDNSGFSSTTATIKGQGIITATFTQNQYQVTFTTNPSGTQSTTNPAGTQTYDPGSTHSISAAPGPGYSFTSWTSTGAITFDNPTSSSTNVKIDSPGQITANFASAQKTTPTLTCTINSTTLQYNDAVEVTGKLSTTNQNLQGETVTISYSTPGQAPVRDTSTTDTAGTYTDTFKPSTSGTWTIQATFAGNAQYNPANSPTQTVVVKPPGPITIGIQTNNIDIDAGSNPIIAIDSTEYNYDQLQALEFNWVPGTIHTLIAANYVPTGDSIKQYAWLNWSAPSFTVSAASTYTYTVPYASENVTANFTSQTLITFAYYDVYSTYVGNDPAINYYNSGTQATLLAASYGSPEVWVDVGSEYNYPAMLPDSNSTQKWQTPQTTDIIQQFNDWIQPFYYGQNNVTLSYTIMGGTGTSQPPTFYAKQTGDDLSQPLTTTPTSYWLDQYAWSIDPDLQGSASQGETWQTNQPTFGTTDELMPSMVFSYYHFYQLTVDTNQPGIAANFQINCTQFGVLYTNQQVITPAEVWIDAGTTAVIGNIENPMGQHVFQSYDPSETAWMDQPKSITIKYS